MEERYIIYKNNRRSNVPDDVQYWIFKNSDKRGYYFINFDEKCGHDTYWLESDFIDDPDWLRDSQLYTVDELIGKFPMLINL